MTGTVSAEQETDSIRLYVFTDPMMGLSYEHEPVLEALRTSYGKRLRIRYVMAGLVRDVADFMTPAERALGADEGIRQYNKRLARIYLQEIPVGGLPMHMEDFHLFDARHRSSYPLDIAYEAARLTAPDKADRYLYALRRATILEGRQTTKQEELVKLAGEAGLPAADFQAALQNGKALAAFRKDLSLAAACRIHSLPSYLIRMADKELLVSGLPGLQEFQNLIRQVEGKRCR